MIKKFINKVRSLKQKKLLSSNENKNNFFVTYRPDFHFKNNEFPNYDELFSVWTGLKSYKGDYGDMVRFYSLYLLLKYIDDNEIDGDIVELGVYKGQTAKLFKTFFPNKQIHLFDTFEGFDEKDILEDKKHGVNTTKLFTDTSLDSVKKYIGGGNIKYYQGYFPDSAINLDETIKYSIVHLDADLYEPMKAGLEYFYSKMAKGGVLIVHDYTNGFKGSRKACDEFFKDKPETMLPYADKSGTAVIIKI
ncbi:TylF/MycF family methyltransferase [Aliarcobacter cryaerophilus]|uniref:TylF/MycF family methyltransferase n=1 Tax=Aliarcobacter cryaerophilus TaxID=28198 RepID=UPI0021B5BEF2|nr:TylF/MycF family methyltransferase [Aliarcobacter cryaerophilus]MCT7517024.1 TylF/MycF family methyltransferase [Aliarcobacter cryaerophilus]